MREQNFWEARHAASIAGVPGVTQRIWRQRGILPPASDPGRVRFDLLGICRLALMRELADAGLPLNTASWVAEDFGPYLAAVVRNEEKPRALGVARMTDGQVRAFAVEWPLDFADVSSITILFIEPLASALATRLARKAENGRATPGSSRP